MPFLPFAPRRRGACLALAALVLPWAVAAQAPAASGGADAARRREVKRNERQFLQSSAGNLRFQAQAARAVLGRSTNLAVLEIASELAARQAAVQPELLRLLSDRGMAPPMFNNEQNKVLKQLARLNGARLDRLFIDEVAMRSAQADLVVHERAAMAVDDPVLKAWAERQRNMLRVHVDKAARTLPGAVTARSLQRSV